MCEFFINEHQWKTELLFSTSILNPNRSLVPEQISLDCWADCLPWVQRRSGLRRERTKNKMPTRKWKMTGSYLFNYESYHNGLMTDLGCKYRTAVLKTRYTNLFTPSFCKEKIAITRINYKNILLKARNSTENSISFRCLPRFFVPSPWIIPNRSLEPEQISLDGWANDLLFVRRRSGLRRERTDNKMPPIKWKMTGSYLLYTEQHYNGLMTDLG